jgi:hypothetical protein
MTDVVLTAVGVGFLLAGLGTWRSQQPIKGGVLTTGMIVDKVTRQSSNSDGSSSTFKMPIIEFTDKFEREHRFEAGTSGFGEEIGDVVQVRYDPTNPSRAQWADQPGKWMWSIFAGIGLLVLLVEIGLLLRRRSRFRSAGQKAGPEGDEVPPSGSFTSE